MLRAYKISPAPEKRSRNGGMPWRRPVQAQAAAISEADKHQDICTAAMP
jgi:hypothetical protein